MPAVLSLRHLHTFFLLSSTNLSFLVENKGRKQKWTCPPWLLSWYLINLPLFEGAKWCKARTRTHTRTRKQLHTPAHILELWCRRVWGLTLSFASLSDLYLNDNNLTLSPGVFSELPSLRSLVCLRECEWVSMRVCRVSFSQITAHIRFITVYLHCVFHNLSFRWKHRLFVFH